MNNKIKSIEDYLQVKSKYQKKVNKLKKEIISADLTASEKNEVWTESKLPCINCNQPVNTYFGRSGKNYIVKCGASFKPVPGYTACNLDKVIETPNIVVLSDELDKINKLIQKRKEEIIKTKLDYIFKYEDEEKTIDSFEKDKTEMETLTKKQEELVNKLHSIYPQSFEYMQSEIEKIIYDIKLLLKDNNIEEAMELQLNRLQPLLEKYRNDRYKEYEIRNDIPHMGLKAYKFYKSETSIEAEEIIL